MTTLYTMAKVNKETGQRIVVYGHVTPNVVNEYWEFYCTDKWDVEVKVFDPASCDCGACIPQNSTGIESTQAIWNASTDFDH